MVAHLKYPYRQKWRNKINIVIPYEGRARTVLCSSFLSAKRLTENGYTLTDEAFQMTGVPRNRSSFYRTA